MKYERVESLAPFDVLDETNPTMSSRFNTDGMVSLTLPVQVDIRGDYVVNGKFFDIISDLSARGAIRRDDYVVSLRKTTYGHFILSLTTSQSYLSREDVIDEDFR